MRFGRGIAGGKTARLAVKGEGTDQQGQALYRAVSAAKADLSDADSTTLRYHHKDIHIERTITRAAFEDWIAPDLAQFDGAVSTARANVSLITTAGLFSVPITITDKSSMAAGDTFRFNVDSITTCQRVTLALRVRRTALS